jgi:hypothetical protein
MNEHSHKPTTNTRSWFRRRHEIESDSVDIDQEDNHAWWAARVEVSAAASTRRMQERLASAPSPAQAAASAAFAPAPVGDPSPAGAPETSTPPHEATRGWDSDSVYEWTARPSDLHAVADDESASAALPWTVLGLDADAPWDEVVRRHRLLAKHLHPDLHATIEVEVRKEIEERMATINAAFADLESLYRVRKGA